MHLDTIRSLSMQRRYGKTTLIHEKADCLPTNSVVVTLHFQVNNYKIILIQAGNEAN